MATTKFNYVWSHISKSLKDFGELISPYVTGAGSDKLAAGDREVTLTQDEFNDALLTFNQGDVTIQTSGSGSDLLISTLGGNDIRLESGDDIVLQGDVGLYDDGNEGGDINIYAGDGSGGDTNDAGEGGDVRIEAGNAGQSDSGNQNDGGAVTIRGGYTTDPGSAGGNINIYPGSSVDNIYGQLVIQGGLITWRFSTNNGALECPVVPLGTLPNANLVAGARAMINDSSVAASTNFGAIAATGGSNIVPVFSNGTNWLIG
jgi:hypothetical protein